MSIDPSPTDVAVLGGGPGGDVAAIAAAQRGARVTLIEQARVLGVHILGPHATDLIAEGALAVQMGLTADDLAWTTQAHPTLPEALLEAALGVRGAAIHVHSR